MNKIVKIALIGIALYLAWRWLASKIPGSEEKFTGDKKSLPGHGDL